MKTSLPAVLAFLLVIAAMPAAAKSSKLEGRWILNQELTTEVQPENRGRTSRFDNLPRPTISIGGMPLPRSGTEAPPATPGSAADPRVLRSSELRITPLGDTLTLDFTGQSGKTSETLARGNQQGLVSRWNATRLTSNYETLSRKVSQTYEVRKDGRLLVTVKLDPNGGRAVVYKRVFDPAESP
jgi:hypothetical protein